MRKLLTTLFVMAATAVIAQPHIPSTVWSRDYLTSTNASEARDKLNVQASGGATNALVNAYDNASQLVVSNYVDGNDATLLVTGDSTFEGDATIQGSGGLTVEGASPEIMWSDDDAGQSFSVESWGGTMRTENDTGSVISELTQGGEFTAHGNVVSEAALPTIRLRDTDSAAYDIWLRNVDSVFAIQDDAQGAVLTINQTGDGDFAGELSAVSMAIDTDTLVTSSGKVGIGTVSPDTNAVVYGVKPEFRIADSIGGTWTDGDVISSLVFWSDDASGTGPRSAASIRAVDDGGSGSSTFRGALDMYTSAYNTSEVLAMRIASSGNVGIGTSSPDQALHVIGAITNSTTINAAGNITSDGVMGGDSIKSTSSEPTVYWEDTDNSAHDFTLIGDAGVATFKDNAGSTILTVSQAGDVEAVGDLTAVNLVGAGASITALNGSSIASGTVADARIAATIARDTEVAAEGAAATNHVALATNDLWTASAAAYQPLDSDLTDLADGTYTGAFVFEGDVEAPSFTLNSGGETVRLALDGDRIFHDTDDDGTKDAGEEYIDQTGGGGGSVLMITNYTATAEKNVWYTNDSGNTIFAQASCYVSAPNESYWYWAVDEDEDEVADTLMFGAAESTDGNTSRQLIGGFVENGQAYMWTNHVQGGGSPGGIIDPQEQEITEFQTLDGAVDELAVTTSYSTNVFLPNLLSKPVLGTLSDGSLAQGTNYMRIEFPMDAVTSVTANTTTRFGHPARGEGVAAAVVSKEIPYDGIIEKWGVNISLGTPDTAEAIVNYTLATGSARTCADAETGILPIDFNDADAADSTNDVFSVTAGEYITAKMVTPAAWTTSAGNLIQSLWVVLAFQP